MTAPPFRGPESYDPKAIGDDEIVALNALHNVLRAESDPDYPAKPVEDTRSALHHDAPFISWTYWRIRDDSDAVVARGKVGVLEGMDGNEHLAVAEIAVAPGARRRGLGGSLLCRAAQRAAELGRSMIMLNTSSAVPAGDRFCEAVGADLGLEAVANQVLIADLDLDLLSSWIADSVDQADYEIRFWDGPYPNDQLDHMVAVKLAMNDQPFDDLDIDDLEFTAEHLRGIEAMLEARRIDRWTLAAIHSPTGAVAGYTEVFWNPALPHLIQQGDTGVDPAHRGRNLGRRLKAAMAHRIVADRPQATAIRTGNAGSNAPMLKINREMGFTPHHSGRTWQLDVETALEWCTARGT
jgi:GNAT superfamily N-acetyltransferase